MEEKKISVIIPCFNVSSLVDRSMSSLEAQTIGIDNLQIILVNDASEDATLGKLLLWEMKYPDNIVVIPLEERVMQGAARNIARQYCSAEYIAYLDADDWILPECYEKTYNAAKKYDADIVNYLSKKTFKGPEEDDGLTESGIPDRFARIHTPRERLELFSGNCPLVRGCWDKLFRRSFVEENDLLFAEGVYDEESLFTIPAYMKAERIFMLNEYQHRYFQNIAGTSHNLGADKRRRDDNATVWLKTYERLKSDGSLDENHDMVEWFFVINYFIRSIVIALGRLMTFDAARISELQDTVHRLFPDYRKNKILMSQMLYKEPLELLETKVTDQNIDSYIDRWKSLIERYGEEL